MIAPYVPRKPSILDRLIPRLFPATQMLEPEVGGPVGRQALLQLGTNLMQAGGASPQQGGTLANIGASLGGVDVASLTQNALALRAQRKLAEVAARHPGKPGETPDEIYNRVAGMVSELTEYPELIGKLSNVLAQLRPQVPRSRRLIRSVELDDKGMAVVHMRDPETGEDVKIGGRAYVPDPFANPNRPTTEDQGKLADFGTRMLEAHAVMSRLEREHPGIGQRVDLKIRPLFTADKVPGLGSAIGSLITPGVLASMSSEEREYWGAEQDLVNARLRRVTGATINRQELETERMPLVPLGGEDESQVSKKQARRFQAARLYIRGAGRAFNPEYLSDEARALLEGQATAPRSKSHPASRSWRDLDPDRQ